jgi:uncharacterized membrane protein YfcA
MEWRRVLALLVLFAACFFAGSVTGAPNWYIALKRPEWVQVILAVIGIAVISWQVWETRRSVDAAKVSADTALLSAKQSVNSERASINGNMKRSMPSASEEECGNGYPH